MNEGPIDLALLYNMEGNINISKISGLWIIFKWFSQKARAVNSQVEHWSSKIKLYLGCIFSKNQEQKRIKDVQYQNYHLLVSAYLLLNKCFFNAVLNVGTLTFFKY